MTPEFSVSVNPENTTATVTGPGWQVDVIYRSAQWNTPPGVAAIDALIVGGSGGAGSADAPGGLGDVVHKSIEVDPEPLTIKLGQGGAGYVPGGDSVCVILSRW